MSKENPIGRFESDACIRTTIALERDEIGIWSVHVTAKLENDFVVGEIHATSLVMGDVHDLVDDADSVSQGTYELAEWTAANADLLPGDPYWRWVALTSVEVHADHRRQGIATVMLDTLLDMPSDASLIIGRASPILYEGLREEVSKDQLERWYTRRGFTIVDGVFFHHTAYVREKTPVPSTQPMTVIVFPGMKPAVQ